MGLEILTLGSSKTYTRESLLGLGALKGAPCTIKSITEVDGGQKVTFEWTGTSGTKQTSSITVSDGVSITSIDIDSDNNLVCTMSDGTEQKAKINILDNVYTKSETNTLLLDKAEKTHNHNDLYASKDTEHEHSNKETLDKFGVNDGGKLTFNGDVVTPEAMDLGDYLKKTDAQNTYVEKETGKGLSENDFTTVLKDAYDKAVEDSHTHSNKSIIDKFSEDSDGALLYDGQSIEADLSTVYKKTETYSQTEADNKFVAKETGKGLSTNDLTNDLKSSYDDAVTAKHTHDNKTVLDGITAEKVEAWDKAEENVQSDWNETDDTADGFIKNKPTIPDITGLATETYVDNKVADYTKTADLADVATSGSYNDLADKPTIPSLDGYAKTSEIPSKVSELENDSNYLSSIPEEYVTETELSAKEYLTEHQDISGKVDKVEGKSLISDTEIARLASVDNYDDTAIKAEIAKKADATAIPSKVSELTNDSNYQTAEQVNSTVTTEIAKVVADAPESLNTLKEMSDWIAGHEDDASAMNSAISDNKTAITALQTGKADKSEIPTTVVELTDSVDYAKTADVNNSISTLQTDKADASDLTAHTGDSVIHVTAENKTLWNTVSNKVNKEDGKALLANTDKTNYDDAVTKAHTHENKEVLDGITSDKVTYWDNKSEFSGSYNDLNDKPTIDAELSNTSENAIQNKVVTKEINKLYSDISFNDHDTATSGTSFTDAEDGNMLVMDWTKNLVNPTLKTTTQNGVTCTNNGDGTYTLNGTATNKTFFNFPISLVTCIFPIFSSLTITIFLRDVVKLVYFNGYTMNKQLFYF